MQKISYTYKQVPLYTDPIDPTQFFILKLDRIQKKNFTSINFHQSFV